MPVITESDVESFQVFIFLWFMHYASERIRNGIIWSLFLKLYTIIYSLHLHHWIRRIFRWKNPQEFEWRVELCRIRSKTNFKLGSNLIMKSFPTFDSAELSNWLSNSSHNMIRKRFSKFNSDFHQFYRAFSYLILISPLYQNNYENFRYFTKEKPQKRSSKVELFLQLVIFF